MMAVSMYVMLIMTLMGFVCGGGYPKGGSQYPFFSPPIHQGPIYPPIYRPPYCGEPVACIPEICQPPFSVCPNFPQARCVTICGCDPRFFIGGVDVTRFCDGPTNPGRPHKKY